MKPALRPVQVAYHVPDPVAAAERCARDFGWGPFFLMEHIPLASSLYRGVPARAGVAALPHRIPAGHPEGYLEAFAQLYRDFARAWRGEVENDDFNRLVLLASLSADEITVLRAYAKYMRQSGFALSQAFIEATLANHPRIARLLVQLFKLRFDPKAADAAAATSQVNAIEQALEKVSSLSEGYMSLEISSGVEVQVQRSAVIQVLPKGTIK